MVLLQPAESYYTEALLDRHGNPLTPTTVGGGSNNLIYNSLSGQGGAADKAAYDQYFPNVVISQRELELLYQRSWAAQRFVDWPVNDMFLRGRVIDYLSKETAERFMLAQRKLGIMTSVAKAMRLGRLYGTGMMAMVVDGHNHVEPLMPDEIEEGSVRAFHCFSQHSARVVTWVNDWNSPEFGQPATIEFRPKRLNRVPPMTFHATRVFRFDGRKADDVDGWPSPNQFPWGISVLALAISEIIQDVSSLQAMSHLLQEASVVVYNTDVLAQAQLGSQQELEQVKQQLEQMNRLKSIYGTIVAPTTDEVKRMDVRMAGWAQYLDARAARLAATAGMPATRFLGRSPVGLNATGDSDMVNYSELITVNQEQMLDPVFQNRLDIVIARHAGINQEPRGYRWLPLTEPTEEAQARVARQWTETVLLAYEDGLVNFDKARELLSEKVVGKMEAATEEERALAMELLKSGNTSGGGRRRSNETQEPGTQGGS